jgi:hypothetical protein
MNYGDDNIDYSVLEIPFFEFLVLSVVVGADAVAPLALKRGAKSTKVFYFMQNHFPFFSVRMGQKKAPLLDSFLFALQNNQERLIVSTKPKMNC